MYTAARVIHYILVSLANSFNMKANAAYTKAADQDAVEYYYSELIKLIILIMEIAILTTNYLSLIISHPMIDFPC